MAMRLIDDLYPSMPWDSVDAVVFDVSGILLAMSPEESMAALFPGRETIYPELRRKMIATPYWNMLDAGSLTLDEAIEAMIGGDTALAEPIRAFMTRWPEFNHPIEEGVETARVCKAHGKKLYILSNYPDEHFAYNEAHFDFLRMFDGILISARERMLKPKPEIYARAAERFQLTPARTLFIDDTPANIEGAFAAGWHGLCVNRPGQLRRFFT